MLLTALVLAGAAAAQPAPQPSQRYVFDQVRTQFVIRSVPTPRCADAKIITASGPALLRPQDRAELKARRLGDLPPGRYCHLGGVEPEGGSR